MGKVGRVATRKGEVRTPCNVLLSKSERERIDEFRFARKFSSRNEAIRWLITYAIEKSGKARNGKVGHARAGHVKEG